MSLTLDQRRSLIKRIESITGLKPNRKAIQTDFDFFNYCFYSSPVDYVRL